MWNIYNENINNQSIDRAEETFGQHILNNRGSKVAGDELHCPDMNENQDTDDRVNRPLSPSDGIFFFLFLFLHLVIIE